MPRGIGETIPAHNTEFASVNSNETIDQTLRETHEERDEKSYNSAKEQERNRELSELSIAEIAAMDPAEIRARYSQEQILAVKAKLEKEYAKRYETEQVAQAEAEAAAVETPETPETPTDKAPLVIPVITPEDVPANTETTRIVISPERRVQTIERAREKAKEDRSIKSFFAKKVLPVVLSAAVLIGGLVGVNAVNKDNANQSINPTTPTEQVQQAAASGESHEHHGIYDGYYETGEFMSANKGTPYDFANAAEVASVVGDDECDVMKEVAHNQVESLADQLANIPDTVKAQYGISPDFIGEISIKDTEAKLESLSDDDYDKLMRQVDQIWDEAFTEKVTLNGEYQNAFMRTSATGNERVTHNNTELVACTTQENGTAATKFYWTVDGNAHSARMGDVIAKISRDDAGHIAEQCTQIVTEVGTFSFLYTGIPNIPNNPNNPGVPNTPGTPGTPDTPDTPDTPEWGKSGDPHSGPNRRPSDLVDPDSEVTQEQNDATNQGKQGYIDDNQATPGSASENNGINDDGFSNIGAEGTDTEGGRLEGGEQQGGEEINGTNPNAPTEEQLARDDTGNAAQEAAQETGNTPGGDNNTNAAEEAAVAGGNF